jgi:hypothetical protein
VVLLFAVLSFAPVTGYFAWEAPSWALGYVVDGDRFPSAVSLAVVLASAGLLVGAFELTIRALAEGRQRLALGWGFGTAALTLAVLAALGSRLFVVGSYAEVTGGFSVASLPSTPLGVAVLGMDVFLGLATFVTLAGLRAPLARTGTARRLPTVTLRGAAKSGEARPLEPARARRTGPRRSGR